MRRTSSGSPIANLRIAVSDSWRDRNTGERKERTEWIPVVIWNEGLCKVVDQYVKKGSRLLIQGKWTTRKWTDQAGADRYSTELVLQGPDARLIMLDSRTSSDGDTRGGDRQQSSYDREDDDDGYQGGRTTGFSRDLDDDIPFAPEWR
jgi:single-strand DNA-binding protein